jgi:hypothetical protein
MGHSIVYLTNANISKSVLTCKEAGVLGDNRDFVQNCYEGLFMQVYQQTEPEDKALVADVVPEKGEILSFCNEYESKAFDACQRESWPYFREEIQTSEGIVDFCSGAKNNPESILSCYSKLFFVVSTILNFDSAKMGEICSAMSSEWKGKCFSDSAVSPVSVSPELLDKGLDLCRIAAERGFAETCYAALADYRRIIFPGDEKEYAGYCNQLPQPWQKDCLN